MPAVISGTAFDQVSGVSLIEVAISSDATGTGSSWYNGTSFTVAVTSNTIWQSTSSWSDLTGGTFTWSWNRPVLSQAKTYSVILRITDNAGNVKTQDVATAERKNFFYDEVNPTVTLLKPNATFINNLPIISGDSSDVDTKIAN